MLKWASPISFLYRRHNTLPDVYSIIDEANGLDNIEIWQFLYWAGTCPRFPRIFRNLRKPSKTYPTSALLQESLLLAESHLSWAKLWVCQNNWQCPVTISIRSKCILNDYRLQMWQSLAKKLIFLIRLRLLETYVEKVHERPHNAKSLQATLLITVIYGLNAFLFMALVPYVSSTPYSYSKLWQMAKHVIIYYPKHAGAQYLLRNMQQH
jgi:hypothetical protein